jgi:3-oxoadipate enol-lactonase
MSDIETGYKEIDGQQIFYQVHGNGDPLVFVHGWTLNLNYWDAQVEYFSKRYRTYCYDWRGMGKSSGATPRFSMEQLGEELAGVIDAFGIKNPVICGHSEGGAIATQYAVTRPDAVKALVLVDTELNTPKEAIEGIIGFSLAELTDGIELLPGDNPLELMMPTLQEKLYSPNFVAANPDFIAAWQKQFLSNSLDGVLNGLRAWDWRKDVGEQMRQVKAPLLLLWGMEDVMISLPEMQNIQTHISAASQLSTLLCSGHMTLVEVPDQFNKVMDGFLSSC